MKRDEIKKLDADTLKKEVQQLKKELFNLKFNVAAGQVKDYSQFKKIRTDIARCLTFLQSKEEVNESKKST